MTEMVDEALMDAEAVAARLGVPKSWVYRAARAGWIPSVSAGRYVRFQRTDVEEFIASGGVRDE